MADKGRGFDDHFYALLQFLRPVTFEKYVNEKLSFLVDKLSIIRDRDEFLNKPLVSVGTELRSARKATGIKRFSNVYQPCLKNVLKTTKKHDGNIVVNSNYGPAVAEKLGKKIGTKGFYACNCGAYIYEIDENGKKNVIKNCKISKDATETILGLLNGDDNIITIHGFNNSYTTERFSPSGGGRLHKAFNWYMSAKKKAYALANKKMFHIEGEANDNGFEVTKNSAYGLTVSPVVQDSFALSGSKIVNGYGEGVLFPVLKNASDAERQQSISKQQMSGIAQTIEKLATAPKDVRKKFENEVDFLITSQGLRIVPKGCNKIEALNIVGDKLGIDQKHRAIFGGGPEDFSLQLSLDEAYMAVLSGKSDNLVKIVDDFDNDYHVTAFEPQNEYGIARTLTTTALTKMADLINKKALEEKKRKLAEAAIKEQLPKFLAHHPTATIDKIEKFKKSVADSVYANLEAGDKAEANDYRVSGYKKLYKEKVKGIANPTKSGPTA